MKSGWRNDLDEAKVDKGKSDAEKPDARNKRNTPAGQDKDTDLKTFITRKPGESLGSAKSRVSRQKHDKKQAATRLAKSKERATGSLKKYDSDGDGKVRVIAPAVVLIKYPFPETPVSGLVLAVVHQSTVPVLPKPDCVAPQASVIVVPDSPRVNVLPHFFVIVLTLIVLVII